MLTAQERALINALDLAHKDVARCATALKHQLERIHQEQIMTPLANAIYSEGGTVNDLVLLERGQRPRVPDPIDPDEARELAREVQWGAQG